MKLDSNSPIAQTKPNIKMEEWKTKKVRDLVGEGIIEKPLDGNHGEIHPKGNDFVSEGIPFITASDVNNGSVDLKNCKFITITQANSLRKGFAKKDDVLLTHKASLGRTAIVPKLNTEFIVLTPQVTYYRVKDKTKLNNQYLKYYFDSSDFQKKFKSFGDAGSTRAYVGISEQLNLPVVIPPIEEQKAIAKILSSLDDKIELNRQMNATLEAIARALFKAWFVDFEPVRANLENRPSESASPEIAKLFPSEFENGIPKGWETKELNTIFEVNPIRSLQKGKNAKYLDMANMPTSGHRVSGWINRDFTSGTKFKKGDTLLARITPCLENGKTTFVDFLDDEEIGWGSTEFIVLRPRNGLPNYFAYLLCRNDDFRNFAIQSMTGTSGRQRVQVDSLGKYLLTVPPKDSLIGEKFGLVLNPIVEKIKQNSEEITRIAQIRDSLLPRLISGKLPIGKIEKVEGEIG